MSSRSRYLSSIELIATIYNQLGISNPNIYYVKKLKVLTGKEPVQLIREMRLEKAKVLLEKRAGTPQAISELVGLRQKSGSVVSAIGKLSERISA